jgi:Xaa-Pro aminopeptidase
MSWPRDDAKLDRVRALMADRELDALVVRAPDNVLYLTDYWCMKGYDLAVFPRDGEPTLVAMEPQEAEARASWSGDVRLFTGYDPDDPRPPTARSVEAAQAVVQEHGYERVGLELSLGTQATDRMVGEPTTYTHDFFHAFGAVEDATSLLVEARAIKTAQEIERMRLANELAAEAMEHVRGRLRPRMTEAEAAAIWQGYVHGVGTGYRDKVELAFPFSLVWSGPGIRTFTATGSRPVVEGQPTLFEIWVCCDGYWADHTKNLCIGELEPRYRDLLDALWAVYDAAVAYVRDGAELAGLDRLVREGIAAAGYPGQPSHPICHGVGARAHEPPYAHQAGGGVMREGMVLAIEPGIYWPEGGGLRLEDNFLVTKDGAEKLSPFPDGIVLTPTPRS